jgi:hypothetical protein
LELVLRLVACAIVILAASCSVSRPTFRCADWEDCGPGGACEPGTQACSFADESCTETGRRFSSISPEPLRDRCVPFEADAPAAALCDPENNQCGKFRECIGDRCISTAELTTGNLLSCGSCSNNLAPGAPIVCWGETSVLAPIPPMWPLPNGFLLAGNFCGAPGNPWCPAECAECPAFPSDPVKCPLSCAGTVTTQTISVGLDHLCFFNGRAYCAGEIGLKLGAGPSVALGANLVISRLDLPNALVKLAAGAEHNCAAQPFSDAVFCWGANEDGQLGVAGPSTATPVLTQPLAPGAGQPQVSIEFVGASARFSCATTTSDVACWGAPPFPTGRVQNLGAGQITAFDVGLDHACVVKGGRVVCWGGNEFGQADPSSSTPLVEPTHVLPNEMFTKVVTGRAHTCAIAIDGAVWCWGATDLDQLDGAVGPGPVKVRADPPAVGPISAGADVTCAVHADDRVRCWGNVLETNEQAYRDFAICDDRGQ